MSGHCKHAVLHHTYVNITNHDADINLGFFVRLTPTQKRFWFHRGQCVYLWPLYGLLAIKWHLLSDFRNVIIGRIGGRRFSRPKEHGVEVSSDSSEPPTIGVSPQALGRTTPRNRPSRGHS